MNDLLRLIPSFQVEEIGMSCVPTDYRTVIIDCLGGDRLRKLKLDICEDVDPLVELLPSSKGLQFLSLCDCTMAPIADLSVLVQRVPRAILDDCSNQFLPKLKKLKSVNTCIGYWSLLFECHRPALAKCILNCSHIGLFPSVTQCINWSDAPTLWPNLQVLGFLSNLECAAVNTLNAIAPHLAEFQYLEKLIVPTHLINARGLIWGDDGYHSMFNGRDALARTGYPLPYGLRVESNLYFDYNPPFEIDNCPHHH